MLIAVIFVSAGKMSIAANATPSDSRDVPVIMYHAIMKDASRSGKYVITPETLRSDIEYILGKGYTPVFMSDLIDFVNYNGELPAKPVVLTFDDGYYNNYVYAYPILKEYGVKAVFSVIGKHTQTASTTGEKQSESYSHVTWDQLKEMSDSGLWEIQNHTYDMHRTGDKNGILEVKADTTAKTHELIMEDIRYMQELIYEHTGKTANTFTYPFGSFDDATQQLIKDMGFSATLSCCEGINHIYKGGELTLLYRYNRAHGKDSKSFFEGILN